jgi:tetratricopeptide (TPR) repeat protein
MNAPQASSSPSAPPKAAPDTAALLDSILRSADAHYAREDWMAARDSLSLAVQLAPDQGQIHAALGSLQYRLQDYPAACASFKTATSKSPENADLHTQLAMVHLQLKQVDEAQAALQQSLKLRPNNPTARQMLGDLDFEATRYADAAQQYCAALGSNPDGLSLLLPLGKCLYELRDLASARWCFERVIALEPLNVIASEALQILAANPSGATTASV